MHLGLRIILAMPFYRPFKPGLQFLQPLDMPPDILGGQRRLFRRRFIPGGPRGILDLDALIRVFLHIVEADDDIAELHLFVQHHLKRLEQGLHGAGIAGERAQHLLQPFLDAFGDLDLALAGQEVNSAHFAHIHPDRIGGAAELVFQADQRRGRLRRRVFIGHIGIVGNAGVEIRRGFMHGDPHIVDHVDDILDLFRLDDIVGQMIIDLVVGQEALFLAFCNQLFEL